MSGLSDKKEIEKAKVVSPIKVAGVGAALAFILFKLSEKDKRKLSTKLSDLVKKK